MFNVGDRVICNSGNHKGKVGIVIEYLSPFEGKTMISVRFAGDYPLELWEYRFSHYDSKQAILSKIKQMESRQTWKRNHV